MLISVFLFTYSVAQAQMPHNTFLNINSLRTERAGVKAAREFWKMNGEEKNEKWYKLPGGYLAEFNEGSIQNKVVFDKNGNWVYTMREYSEKELPKDVRRLVKSIYYDFSIGWVKEVSQFQSQVYVVHIDGPSEWKDLLVRDGEIEEQRSAER
jgi:hypothetical protein